VCAADVDHPRLAVDVAMLERNPLPGPEAGRGSEQHEWTEARSQFCRERAQLVPRFERPLLRAPALRVVDALLSRIHVDHAPADSAREHLPERLGRLEAMPGWNRHPPAAISAGRSWLIRRWPNTRTAFASSQCSFE